MISLKKKIPKGSVVPVTDSITGNMETGPTNASGQPEDVGSIELLKLLGIRGYNTYGNTLRHMNYVASTIEIRERCKSTWGTMGVVSALLAGLSIVPPLNAQSIVGLNAGTDAWTSSPWLLALLYLSFSAFLCNMAVIIMSTNLYIWIDHLFTDQYLMDFLRDWEPLCMLLPYVFGLSILVVVGEVIVVIGYTCSDFHVWILMGSAALVFTLLLAMTLQMVLYVEGRCANMALREEYGPNWVKEFKKR